MWPRNSSPQPPCGYLPSMPRPGGLLGDLDPAFLCWRIGSPVRCSGSDGERRKPPHCLYRSGPGPIPRGPCNPWQRSSAPADDALNRRGLRRSSPAAAVATPALRIRKTGPCSRGERRTVHTDGRVISRGYTGPFPRVNSPSFFPCLPRSGKNSPKEDETTRFGEPSQNAEVRRE